MWHLSTYLVHAYICTHCALMLSCLVYCELAMCYRAAALNVNSWLTSFQWVRQIRQRWLTLLHTRYHICLIKRWVTRLTLNYPVHCKCTRILQVVLSFDWQSNSLDVGCILLELSMKINKGKTQVYVISADPCDYWIKEKVRLKIQILEAYSNILHDLYLNHQT